MEEENSNIFESLFQTTRNFANFQIAQLLPCKFDSVSLQQIFSLQCCQIINFANIELLKIIKSDNRDLAAVFSIGVNNSSSGVI